MQVYIDESAKPWESGKGSGPSGRRPCLAEAVGFNPFARPIIFKGRSLLTGFSLVPRTVVTAGIAVPA